MSEEEIDALYNEILKLPQFEGPITATTCEINVNDSFDKTRAFRKIPTYTNLFNENKRLKSQLQQKENIINELEKYIVIKLQEFNTTEEYYTLKQIDDIYYKLQKLKGSGKNV